jgi:hypothetical protein
VNRSSIVRLLGACAVAGLVVACSDDQPAETGAETPPAAGLSAEVCTRLWDEARGDQTTVAQAAAGNYVTDFALVDADKDGQLSQAEWEAGCAAGTVREPATN